MNLIIQQALDTIINMPVKDRQKLKALLEKIYLKGFEDGEVLNSIDPEEV